MENCSRASAAVQHCRAPLALETDWVLPHLDGTTSHQTVRFVWNWYRRLCSIAIRMVTAVLWSSYSRVALAASA
jgi:hypothetical protein